MTKQLSKPTRLGAFHLKIPGKHRIKDTLVTLLLVAIVTLTAHFWITDRRGVLRAVFPLEAITASIVQQCSDNAPLWLGKFLGTALWQGYSLANQVAYVTSSGVLSHCENGWQGRPLVSTPVEAASRFRYASLTKLFTADAVLAMADAEMLDLDDNLAVFIPKIFPADDERIQQVTLAMLLKHTAGFDRNRSIDPLFELNNMEPWCPYQLQHLSTLRLDFKPGSKAVYSNIGYCILGEVIESVSGESYRDYIADHYGFMANGMEFIDGPYMADEVRYDFRNAGFFMPDYWQYFNFKALSAVAGLSGNASALATSIHSMLNRKPYSIISGQPLSGCDMSDLLQCFVLGMGIYKDENWQKPFFVKGGYLPGTTSIVVVDIYGGVTVLLTASRMGESSRIVLYNILHEALQRYYR